MLRIILKLKFVCLPPIQETEACPSACVASVQFRSLRSLNQKYFIEAQVEYCLSLVFQIILPLKVFAELEILYKRVIIDYK